MKNSQHFLDICWFEKSLSWFGKLRRQWCLPLFNDSSVLFARSLNWISMKVEMEKCQGICLPSSERTRPTYRFKGKWIRLPYLPLASKWIQWFQLLIGQPCWIVCISSQKYHNAIQQGVKILTSKNNHIPVEIIYYMKLSCSLSHICMWHLYPEFK